MLRERYAAGAVTHEQLEEQLDTLFAARTRRDLDTLVPADAYRPRVRSLTPTVLGSAEIDAVEAQLSRGERIEWVGRPDPGKHFTRSDVFVIPFSVMWGGFAIVWETAAIVGGAPPFFVLWGIPFVAMGFYLMIGRFFHKAYRRRRTLYAVTNRRVMAVVRRRRGEAVDSLYLGTLPSIATQADSKGRGSVEFGMPARNAWYANSGMEWIGRGDDVEGAGVGFYDIEDARGVADLVERLREQDRS